MQKDRKLFSEGKLKKRYKMYKAGKSWVAAPLVFFSLGAFSLGVTPVKADQAQNEPQKAVDESIYTISEPAKGQEVVLQAANSANRSASSQSLDKNTTSQTPTSEVPAVSSQASANETAVTQTSQARSSANETAVAQTRQAKSSATPEVKSLAPSSADPDSLAKELKVATPVSQAESVSKPLAQTSEQSEVLDEKSATTVQVLSKKASVATKTSAATTEDNNTSLAGTDVEKNRAQKLQTLELSAISTTPVTMASVTESKAQTEGSATADPELKATAVADGSTANVTTANEFYDALNNGTIKTINILDDIDYGAKYSGGRHNETVKNARDLTINGNGHQIDFGTVNIGFKAANDQSMALVMNDLTLYAIWGFGALSINPTFVSGPSSLAKGVTQTIKYNNVHYYGSQTVMTKTATVILAGDSTFNSSSSYTSKFRKDVKTEAGQQNFELSALEIEPNAKITMTTDRGGNVYINNNGTPHFTVGKNATVDIVQTNTGSNTRAEKSSALIYTQGAVELDEGATVNVDIQNADNARDNTGSIIYISNGSLTLNKNSMMTVGKNSSGDLKTLPIVYLYGNSSKVTVNEGAKLGICNTAGLKASSDIYMYNGGTIRINGLGATLDISNKGDMNYGNIYIGGAGQIFVNDGGTLDVRNQTTTANTLINTKGSATLSFGKDSNVDLEGTGTGKTTLITASSGSKISIYRPENVIFDNTHAGADSKLFNFAGDLNAQFVEIGTIPQYSQLGPFKVATYQLDKNGTSSLAKANVIGLNDAATQAGKELADRLGTSNYLQYTTRDMQNYITLDQAQQLTAKQTTLTGKTMPDAYVTLKYYANGKLVDLPGLSYTLTAPTEATPDYVTKADSTGKWTVTLPMPLDAGQILVAGSTNNFTPAYTTAFVNDTKADISGLASDAAAIASIASSTASQAGIMAADVSQLASQRAEVQDLADAIYTEVNSYSQSAGVDLKAGSNAASAALEALNSSMAASDASATNDTVTETAQNSAQASYASVASQSASLAANTATAAHAVATKVTNQLATLSSQAQAIVTQAERS